MTAQCNCNNILTFQFGELFSFILYWVFQSICRLFGNITLENFLHGPFSPQPTPYQIQHCNAIPFCNSGDSHWLDIDHTTDWDRHFEVTSFALHNIIIAWLALMKRQIIVWIYQPTHTVLKQKLSSCPHDHLDPITIASSGMAAAQLHSGIPDTQRWRLWWICLLLALWPPTDPS